MQGIGRGPRGTPKAGASPSADSMSIQWMGRDSAAAGRPRGATLFSAAHATTQAWQPTQRSRSMAMAKRCPPPGLAAGAPGRAPSCTCARITRRADGDSTPTRSPSAIPDSRASETEISIRGCHGSRPASGSSASQGGWRMPPSQYPGPRNGTRMKAVGLQSVGRPFCSSYFVPEDFYALRARSTYPRPTAFASPRCDVERDVTTWLPPREPEPFPSGLCVLCPLSALSAVRSIPTSCRA
jgi:hypothetical protein